MLFWHGFARNIRATSSGSWQGGIRRLVRRSSKVGRTASLRSCPDHGKTPPDTGVQGGSRHSHFETYGGKQGHIGRRR